MNRTELAGSIDHTVLGPETTWNDVATLLDEADRYGMNACIPPCYVAEAADRSPAVRLVTVVGFPHGQNQPPVKRNEAITAWEDGADEVDVVLNRGRLRGGDDELVFEELAELVAAVPIPVKVIVESGALNAELIRRAAELAVEADADYLKTSTGFVDRGATAADVRLLGEYLPVKASGGIRRYETAMEMIDAGAERIGTSSGVDVLEGAPEE